MKQKHAELIKAWADGAQIQFLNCPDEWFDVDNPQWHKEGKYRIKPEEKQPVVRWLYTVKNNRTGFWNITSWYMTDEEVQKFPDPYNHIKLEYTRQEFPE
jgi:hypothetical protein